MADTSKPRTRRSSTASKGGGSRASTRKPAAPAAAGGSGSKAAKPKAATTKPRAKAKAATPRRTSSTRRPRKGGAGGRGMPGPSLRTLVLMAVAVALVVVGAAVGVSVDKMLRGDDDAPMVATPAPAPAPTPQPRPQMTPAPAAQTPPRLPAAEPDNGAAGSGVAAVVTPPAALKASEALDYAHAKAEYREVPPSLPPASAPGSAPATGDAATQAAPAPQVKPAAPPAPQVAALPVLPKRALDPSPQVYDGQPPWLRNAVPAPPVKGRPMIAVVIDDLGVDKRRSSGIVGLPGPLTTAWMTYADDVNAQARKARAAGHELIIHMPMEPLNTSIDSGPDVLRTTMSADQVRRQVRAGIARIDGVVGVNNHMGSKFTADAAGMAVVIDEMRAHGLLFLDSKTSPKSVGARLAQEAGVPNAERHVFIDNVDDVGAVLRQLAETERVARRTGYAIAIGHPHDGTIQALKQWLPTLEGKGLVLVPLSAIVRERMGLG